VASGAMARSLLPGLPCSATVVNVVLTDFCSYDVEPITFARPPYDFPSFNPLNQNRWTILKNREKWMELCAQAAIEQDPAKLLVLVKEISRLLEEKEQRLQSRADPPDPSE